MKGISLTTIALAFAAASFIIAGISMLLPPKETPNGEKNVTTSILITTIATTSTVKLGVTTSIPTTVQTTTTITQPSTNQTGMGGITTTTSTIPIEKEICCNEIDDDGDGLENGADPDCQVEVDLKAGNNSVCWATEVLDYGNDRDYSSGWFKCPEGYVVEYVTISFLSKSEEEIYLPLESGDCLISYNEYNQVRKKVCGYKEEQEGMNCSSGYIDYKTGEVSPVYICIQETGNPKTNKVRLRFISNSEKTATGVMATHIYCKKEEEKKVSRIDFCVEVNETCIKEPEITLVNGTEVIFRATLNVSNQMIYLERDGKLIASGVQEISLSQTLGIPGTFNYTAYWPGNENYTGSSKSIMIEVIEKEKKKMEEEICRGNVSLDFVPSQANVNMTITAQVYGLHDCYNLVAFVKENSCEGPSICECNVSDSGCSCEFNVTEAGNYTYFACVDIDEDGVYEIGETYSKVLNVLPSTSATTSTTSTSTTTTISQTTSTSTTTTTSSSTSTTTTINQTTSTSTTTTTGGGGGGGGGMPVLLDLLKVIRNFLTRLMRKLLS